MCNYVAYNHFINYIFYIYKDYAKLKIMTVVPCCFIGLSRHSRSLNWL